MSQVYFSIFKKLTCTETQQSTDKAIKHNATVFFARINRWCQLFLLSFILSSFYSLAICSNFRFLVCLHHLRSTTPPFRAGIKRLIPHCPQPLKSIWPPPGLSTGHRNYLDTYIAAPAISSDAYLLSPNLDNFLPLLTPMMTENLGLSDVASVKLI